MGAGIKAALEGLASDLTAGGLVASIDASELQAPCVWVDVDHLSPEFLDGDGTLWATLHLIAPNAAPVDALTMLDDLLEDVLELVDPEDDILAETVILPSNASEGLPALRLTTLRPYNRTE